MRTNSIAAPLLALLFVPRIGGGYQIAWMRYAAITTTIADTISHPIAASKPLTSSPSIPVRLHAFEFRHGHKSNGPSPASLVAATGQKLSFPKPPSR